MSFNGPIGLDYNVVNLLMDYTAIPSGDRLDVLQDITSLERGYLSVIQNRRK